MLQRSISLEARSTLVLAGADSLGRLLQLSQLVPRLTRLFPHRVELVDTPILRNLGVDSLSLQLLLNRVDLLVVLCSQPQYPCF